MTPETVSALITEMLVKRAWCNVNVRCENGRIEVVEVTQTIKQVLDKDRIYVMIVEKQPV